MVKLKRIYDAPSRADGERVLVERLWPRGMKKEQAGVDAWMKEVAPSPELRKWFGHDPEKWEEFQRRYRRELRAHPEPVRELRRKARNGNLTLLYAARDERHNSAVVLRQVLSGH